jgi:hypothetical protein
MWPAAYRRDSLQCHRVSAEAAQWAFGELPTAAVHCDLVERHVLVDRLGAVDERPSLHGDAAAVRSCPATTVYVNVNLAITGHATHL